MRGYSAISAPSFLGDGALPQKKQGRPFLLVDCTGKPHPPKTKAGRLSAPRLLWGSRLGDPTDPPPANHAAVAAPPTSASPERRPRCAEGKIRRPSLPRWCGCKKLLLQLTWLLWGGTWEIHFLLQGASVSCHVSWREGTFQGVIPITFILGGSQSHIYKGQLGCFQIDPPPPPPKEKGCPARSRRTLLGPGRPQKMCGNAACLGLSRYDSGSPPKKTPKAKRGITLKILALN